MKLVCSHALEDLVVCCPVLKVWKRNPIEINPPLLIVLNQLDQSARICERKRAQQYSINNAENRGVCPDPEGERQNDDKRKARGFPQRARAVANIHNKALNGWPLPDLAAVLFNQSYIPKLALSGVRCLFSRQAARHQLLNLLFEVFPNLFGKLVVELLPEEQSCEPTHDSPGAKTRVIPSSILSNRDTSCSRCFAPFVVSL